MSEAELEKHIEKKVCDYAKSKGILVFKFSSPGRAAVPDRLFITKTGVHFFVEFKRKGAKPTEAQKREISRLREHNAFVTWVDDVERGKFIIDCVNTGMDLKTWNGVFQC